MWALVLQEIKFPQIFGKHHCFAVKTKITI